MLSFLVASIAVSVYDICMTTLFVCAVRDAEYFGGRYSSATLREAMQMAPSSRPSEARVEMPELVAGVPPPAAAVPPAAVPPPAAAAPPTAASAPSAPERSESGGLGEGLKPSPSDAP